MSKFVPVAKVDEIGPGELKLVEAADQQIALANVNGTYYAFDAECTHSGGPLDEGELDDDIVTCPWHAGQFNVMTGEVVGPPPEENVTTYEVRVQGTDIEIAI